MESSFTFVRVRGIPIGAHWSWLLVFGLIVYSLTSALFPQTVPGLADATYLWMGLITGILFFVSILLHELGHAFRALTEGMKIEGITLWLFGGVARFRGMFPSAGAEFRIAAAGPIVSVVLAAGFFGLGYAASLAGAPDAIVAVLDYLATINGLVVAFNLVPALPLDGGRILRSWLWHRQRSFPAATRSAARAGKVFGGVLALVGLLNFFAGGTTGGLWLVFLGYFLIQAAQTESAMVLVTQALGEKRIRDLMTPDPDTVDPRTTVAEFIEGVMRSRGHSTYPVVEDGRAVGLMSVRLASVVDQGERTTATIRDVMVPVDRVPVAHPDAPMTEVIDDLQEGPRRALVQENGRLLGILSISDVARAVEVQKTVGPRADRSARRAGIVVWVIVAAIIAAAAGYLYHPPVVVMEPGVTLDVLKDVEISGTSVDDVDGSYLLTSVRIQRPNGLGALYALLTGPDELLPASAVVPEGVDPERFAEQQEEIFDQSREIAAAAAAQAVGMNVQISGSGAIVQDVVPDSPASEVLQSGDVIVEIDGQQVEVAQDAQQAIRSRPAGSEFQLTVLRDGRRVQVTVQSTSLPELVEAAPVIGVVLDTRDFQIDLPFEVEFQERAIGGPSAGLTYALAIADLLDDRNFASGRTIGATGTIGPSGDVGPVGGVPLKAVAVEDAGGTLFLIPESQVQDIEADVDVRGVSTLQEALEVLQQTAGS